MFRRFYILKVLCSEGSMFRRSYIQKVLCSEGPVFRKKMFKSSYIQKVLCSEGPIFRFIQKILYSENSLFYVEKTYIFQFQVNCHQDNKSQPLILAHSIKGQMSFCHGPLSVVCPSTICQNCYWDFNQHSEQPQIRSDHRRIVPLIQEYDTPVDQVISACSNFGTFHFSSAIIIIIFARFWRSRILSPREIREN